MVDFVIVGTARSGTTLVQRLVCELPNVRVPPETRFFAAFVPLRLGKLRFPLTGQALRQEIATYMQLPSSQGLDLDLEVMVQRLNGRCDSYAQLFDALVATLAYAGEQTIVGEKTPIHLQWWKPISLALPSIRFIGVVRDPRAVVASMLGAWGGVTGGATSGWRLAGVRIKFR